MKLETKIHKYIHPPMVVDSYKELCRLLKIKEKHNEYRIKQIKEIGEWISFYRDGHKFCFTEFIEPPHSSIPGHKYTDMDCFDLSFENRNRIGVYIIHNEDTAYIGSTVSGFLIRFRQHYNSPKSSETTGKLLKEQGGIFQVLEYMDGSSLEDVRKKEEYYINLYKKTTNYHFLNLYNAYTIKEPKLKYSKIKVFSSDLYDIMKLLQESGYYAEEIINNKSSIVKEEGNG